MAIPKGATPTLTLTFQQQELDFTQALHVYVTLRDSGGSRITKADDELDIGQRQIGIFLTQTETLSFNRGKVEVQVNCTYVGGRRVASEIATVDFSENLLNKVVK